MSWSMSRSNCRTSRVPMSRSAAPDRSMASPGFYNMVFQYKDADVGREASKLALDFIAQPVAGRAQTRRRRPTVTGTLRSNAIDFIRYAQRREFGPSTASLVDAAEERDIPWLRLNRYSLVQFGHGRYQQRIQATTTGRTSNIAVELASDKEETNGILRDLGLPVPKQMMVRNAKRCRARGRAHRLPGGAQAAGRQPWPRRLDQPAYAGRGRGRFRQGERARQQRSWSRVTSRDSIIACWSSTGNWSRPPSACPVTWLAMANTRSKSLSTSSTRTRAAALGTRKF